MKKLKQKILMGLVALSSLATIKAQINAPGVDWQNFTWLKHEYKSTTPVAQRYSDYDWWYDHCTGYANPSTKTGHLGYFGCGVSKYRCTERSNLSATPLTYNEQDPIYGPYANGCVYAQAPINGDIDYGNWANPVSGSLGLGFNSIGKVKPNGQTDYLFTMNYDGEYLRVKQIADANFITVGRSVGTRKRTDPPQNGTPLYYNPTSANSLNYFSNTIFNAAFTQHNSNHWDVMKFNANGTCLFNNIYGFYLTND